jgi:hypothetical protein
MSHLASGRSASRLRRSFVDPAVATALGALFVAACTASASIGPAPAAGTPATVAAPTPAAAAPPRPTTAEACKACNGIWAAHGISQTESCNCRTTDAGKRCRDGGDCQGVCIAADEPERETVEAGPPARGFFVGKCSETMTAFGCSRMIDRGAVARGPVSLAEPPEQLCVD